MSSAQFYPYRTAPEGLILRLACQGQELPTASDGSLLVTGLDVPEILMEASVLIGTDVWREVFAAAEKKFPPGQVLLRWRSSEARTRGAWPLEGDGLYVHRFPLALNEWAGTVEFQAVLIRTTENGSLPPDYAHERGALLAWSESIRVHIDEPPQPPGDFIDVLWVRFTEDPRYQRYRDHLFALDTSGARPRLVLNSSIPGAHAVLESRGTHGANARIRDATYFMVAHQVWSSLLATALTNLGRAAGERRDPSMSGSTGREMLQELELWQRSVIVEWASDLMDDRSRTSALERLLAEIHRREFVEDLLLRRLPTAVQERLKTYRGFDGLVQEMARR